MLLIENHRRSRVERCESFCRLPLIRGTTAVLCTIPVMVLSASGDAYLAKLFHLKEEGAAVFAIVSVSLLYIPSVYAYSPLYLLSKLKTLHQVMGGGVVGKGFKYSVLIFFGLSTTLSVGTLVHESYHKTSVSATEAEAAILLLCLLVSMPQVLNSMIRFAIRVLQWRRSTESFSVRRLTVVNVLDVITFLMHSVVGYYVGIDMFAPKMYLGLNFLTNAFFDKDLKDCNEESCDLRGSIFTTLCIFALSCSLTFSLSAMRPFATVKNFFKLYPHGDEDRSFSFFHRNFLLNMAIFLIVESATLIAVCGLVGHFKSIEDTNPSPNSLESSEVVAFTYFALIYGLRPLSGLTEYAYEGYKRRSDNPQPRRQSSCDYYCGFFRKLSTKIWNYCSGESSEDSQALLSIN